MGISLTVKDWFYVIFFNVLLLLCSQSTEENEKRRKKERRRRKKIADGEGEEEEKPMILKMVSILDSSVCIWRTWSLLWIFFSNVHNTCSAKFPSYSSISSVFLTFNYLFLVMNIRSIWVHPTKETTGILMGIAVILQNDFRKNNIQQYFRIP